MSIWIEALEDTPLQFNDYLVDRGETVVHVSLISDWYWAEGLDLAGPFRDAASNAAQQHTVRTVKDDHPDVFSSTEWPHLAEQLR